uniref:Uncharacterized protein n=1 Tax=Oryza nivara TaxID=4536 RepID=A0A0E0FM18_ORYNI
MGPESSELPYGSMKFWAAHRVTNNDHEEEDAYGDPVDPLEWDDYARRNGTHVSYRGIVADFNRVPIDFNTNAGYSPSLELMGLVADDYSLPDPGDEEDKDDDWNTDKKAPPLASHDKNAYWNNDDDGSSGYLPPRKKQK